MRKTGKKLLSALLIAAALSASVVTAAGYSEITILGDADGDNYVTVLDATSVQRRLADLETDVFIEQAADADNDGEVTILDATEVQRHLADLPANDMIGKMIGEWINKETTQKSDYEFEQHLRILDIYPDFFIAQPIFPLPYIIKINGSIFDHWCVGDQVYCVCNNFLCEDDIYPNRYEGDLVSITESTFVPDPNVAYKPVIYLYPEEETEVDVSLDLNGTLLISEPLYNAGWTVRASHDGALTDADGRTYDYLLWEAKLNADYDLSEGFCIRGGDTEAFLDDALKQLGLDDREAADFIDFWLPVMKANPYNVISFQTDAYTDAAGLNVSPQPDTVIRVFMTWYASDSATELPAQELTAPERRGFTVVEWGGSMVKA